MKLGIAGAGLLGRLLAWRLSLAGHRVTVVDPGEAEHGEAAAWVAAGLLSPWAELECGGVEVHRLGLQALRLWPSWLAELGAEAPEAGFDGSLLLATERASAERLFARFRAAELALPEALDEARQAEPALQAGLHAWRLPGEGWLNPAALMRALPGASAGVEWQWRRRVERVEPGRLDGQVFDRVFDTRGLGARVDLPGLRGVRGEIFELHAPGLDLRMPMRLLHPRWRVYVVPRAGQRLVVGASEIDSEDLGPVSVRSSVELLGAAQALLPALAEARLLAARCGLRPALPDNLPLLQQTAGLTRINGLYRHGCLIAPALIEQALEAIA